MNQDKTSDANDGPGRTAMQFDETASRRLEAIYLTPDVVAQRVRVLELLPLSPGERVADLGCGPGLLAEMVAQRVGAEGSVQGIDLSESMIALARRRCAGYGWAAFQSGSVDALPSPDRCFDAAVSVQVYEYVSDLTRALAELHRVLKPGGRALIVDTDWESCVWHSSDSARMRRFIETWDTHCPHPQLPRTLANRLRQAGFELSRQEVIPLLNTVYDPNTYSHGMIDVIARYARKRCGEAEAQAWADDLRMLGERGEYFFSLNRYVFLVRRPSAEG